MCDAFGAQLFDRPFQKYKVYRNPKKGTIYVFGIDQVLSEYSVLKIPRVEGLDEPLALQEGETRFLLDSFKSQLQLLRAADGGLEDVAQASGLVGFIRFLQGPYLILIIRDRKVGKIGHHYVHSIEKTMLLPLFAESARLFRDEKSLRDQFNAMDLSKDFYFSHSYELSRTAQQNLADAARAAQGERRSPLYTETDSTSHHRFVWNHFHLEPFLKKNSWQQWCLPIIHGFFAYTKCSSFGWTFEIVLIARRSRFYAGTRYRKRGLNHDGFVGNDVETEQLLCDDATRHLCRGHVMGFVQVRGSVPLFWSQEGTPMNPKPPVIYHRCDPTLSATRLHFADLLGRYGTPLLVVNLMKAKKVDSHEVRLGKHFESAIERLNRELPPQNRILYRPFDMKNHAKSSSIYDVFARLAESVVMRVGFFHTASGLQGTPERLQGGIVRANCVDCLDRTNVLQFFVGLEVLKQQLTAINLLPEPRLDFDSPVVAVLGELYDLMGDHLALQYAGSVAHKKYQLLGSRPRMMASSKELLTSIHRHYNNSFTDNEKQASLNLFLGIYNPREHPRLWETDCDSWVHHRPLHDTFNYGKWWESPLEAYAANMHALSSENLPVTLVSPESQQSLFQQVHVVGKLTWFEELLASLEETSVQINRQTRRLSTLRPYQTILNRKPALANNETHGGSVCSTKRLVDGPFEVARPVDDCDDKVYKEYIDIRQLSRYIWQQKITDLGRCEMNLSMVVLPLSRPEQTGMALMDLFQSHPWREEMQAEMGQKQNDEAQFVFWFLRKYNALWLQRERKHTASSNFDALIPKAAARAQAKCQKASRQRSSLADEADHHQSKLPQHLCLCAYCDEAFDASDEFCRGESFKQGSTQARWYPSMPLCSRHRQRIKQMQQFIKHTCLEDRPSQVYRNQDSPVILNVGAKDPAAKCWQGWLKLSKPVTDQHATSTRRKTSDSESDERARLLRDRRSSFASEPSDTSAEQCRHLWSYAFPYMPPPAPEDSKLGLPEWWLQSLEKPASQHTSNTEPEPAIGAKRQKDSVGRKRERPSMLTRQGSNGHTRVPSQRDSDAKHSTHSGRGLEVAATIRDDGSESIFSGITFAQILEEQLPS